MVINFKKIKIIFFFIIIFNLTYNVCNAKIIFQKNNFHITSYEVNEYLKFYRLDNLEINKGLAVKNIYLIKNLVTKLERNENEWLNRINNLLNSNINDYKNIPEIIKYIHIYETVKNDFIYDYYYNDLKVNEFERVLFDIDGLKFPISKKNCLIIDDFISIANNVKIAEILFNSMKSNIDNIEIIIANVVYKICLDKETSRQIEERLYLLVESKIKNRFKKFIYDK